MTANRLCAVPGITAYIIFLKYNIRVVIIILYSSYVTNTRESCPKVDKHGVNYSTRVSPSLYYNTGTLIKFNENSVLTACTHTYDRIYNFPIIIDP